MKEIRIRKSDLPVPLVIEGEHGEVRVLEIAPAGEGKLGAFIRDAGHALRKLVLGKVAK